MLLASVLFLQRFGKRLTGLIIPSCERQRSAEGKLQERSAGARAARLVFLDSFANTRDAIAERARIDESPSGVCRCQREPQARGLLGGELLENGRVIRKRLGFAREPAAAAGHAVGEA